MSHYTQENGPADYFPPIAALFQGGIVPSSVSLQSLIADIDGQLDSNTKQLDLCLQSILSTANNLPSSQTFSVPKDALGYMCNSHTLEKDTCYDPEMDEAVAIINALCDSLEKNPGSEESILQEILGLASDEGLVLPLRCSPATAINQSSSSLNVQLDTGDQLIEGKWSKLSQSIQKHIISELLKIPPLGQNLRCPWAVIERRLELVGGLRSLSSDDEAWITYRNVRGQQLELLFNSLLPDNDSENVNYKEFCCNCQTVADKIMEMIEEDFSVLCTGVFKKIGGVHRILHDLYLEKYSDEMSVLVEEIADDIRDFNKKVVKASKSDHGLAKADVTGNKSPQPKPGSRGSLGAASSDLWAAKTPSLSQSLDTMFLASSYKMEKDKSTTPRLQKQSSMAFPKDCITSLRLIATSLMKLEDFLDSLTKMTSWDVTGLPTTKKVKKKSSLRGVLKPSSSPEQKRHSLNLGSSFSSSDTPNESSTPVAHLPPSQQPDNTPPPKVVERNRSEDKCRWDWRLIFKKIAPGLATAIETKLDMTMSSTLAHETALWTTEHVLETAEVDFVQFNDGMDHPWIVSKDTHEFIHAVNELLPLARAGVEGCLIPVKMAFIDSIGIAVKNFNLHCVTLSKDIPQKANLKQLLIIISNAVHIKNYLHHLETVLSAEDNGKKFMSSLLKQYTELVDGLGKYLLQLHHQLISTAVLTDAESGNWSEIKDFYEDERCSFTIQMWNYHLRGVQYDMWKILPPKLAQNFFSSILQDSLLLLMQRYARIKPSFRRIKQFRYDITTILLCTSDHLLKASCSLSQYLDAGHNQLPYYSIHNQCSNLLAILALVSSPVEMLYRVFKRGYNRKLESQGSGDNSHGGCNTNWLHWIWPSLIHSGTKHYDDMQTAAALYLHLRIFLSQPQNEWGSLTEALLMKDQTLSILLITRTCMLEGSQASILANTLRSKAPLAASISTEISPPVMMIQQSTQSSLDSNSPLDSSPLSPTLDLPAVGVESETPSDIQQVVDAIVHVTAQVRYFPNALGKCIVPTIERCASWEMFNVKNPLVNPRMIVPEWLVSVFKIMDPFIERTLEPMLRYVNRVKTADRFIRPVISYVADLPCGCPPNYSLKDHPKPPDIKEVLTRCIQLVILEMEKCVVVLPASVCCLFNAIDHNCKEQGIKTSHNCVALQIIAWAMWLRLGQFATNTDKLGTVIGPDARGYMMTVSDTLFHVLVYGRGPYTPQFAARFIKNNKEWLQQRLESIKLYISDEFHGHASADITETGNTTFTDHIYSMLASSIMDSPNGYQELNTLCHLIRNNGPWLLEQMDIQSPLASSTESRQKKLSFKLDISQPVRMHDFNPVKEMNLLGDGPFNHNAIIEFTYDWMALLTSDLGLSKVAFKSLLMNRHEMQDGAILDDAEKKPVDVLRAVYEH